jgi:squalene synthase HpnC
VPSASSPPLVGPGSTVGHYENFPVASILTPPALRPAVVALYRFARTADDLADEGEAPAEARRRDLLAYRADLHAAAAGRGPSERWASVFCPLGAAIARHALPVPLLDDLLDAFLQDTGNPRHADRRALLDYCRRSANPVGRLLLHLYGIDDTASLAQSDAICTALQLANFWQDLGRDARHGRLYLPEADCRAAEVDPDAVLAGRDSPELRALVRQEVQWTRDTMLRGAPLARRVPGRAGWELRVVVQGGLRVLERIDRLDGGTLAGRPVLGWRDAPPILWRVLAMGRA